MNKILLIGNTGLMKKQIDGQTSKVRLYFKKIQDEGYETEFVDLELFFKKPISTLNKIKKGIKKCDRIVLLTSTRGCKVLIPYINLINRKYNKPFILPLIGTSVLHYSIDKLNSFEKKDFILNKNFNYIKPKKSLIKQLKKITYILPETDLLTDIFKEYYNLKNVVTLNNFRENLSNETTINKNNNNNSILKLVFVSRVCAIKGIFDLIDVANNINEKEERVFLDIYGEKLFSDDEKTLFENNLNKNDCIKYKGVLKNEEVIKTINNYDLLVFPTRYEGEGTPGIIAESLIGGVPVLSSSFYQYKFLLKDNYDSIIFEQFNKHDLKDKIIYIIENRDLLLKMKINALDSGKKYTYEFNRDLFLQYICGKKD